MDYYSLGWDNIYVGAALIAFGTFLVSYVAGLFQNKSAGKEQTANRKRLVSVFRVTVPIAGALCVGLGGMKSTQGWNQLDKHEQKQDLIVAVDRELKRNYVIMQTDWHLGTTKKEIQSKIYPYTRLHTSATYALWTSSLLDMNSETEQKIYNLLLNYEAFVARVHGLTDIITYALIMTRKDEGRVRLHRLISESGMGDSLIECHNDLSESVKSNYPDLASGPWTINDPNMQALSFEQTSIPKESNTPKR